VEVSALKHTGVAGIHGRSPLLRLQSDEKLIALIRRGNHHAFEALMGRYQSRLLAFCRHMLSSKEDAEDVLQEVFAAAFNAIQADDRTLNVRPWLYRIARNRSLNHLRRAQPIGVDSMDVHFAEGGQTTADKVHRREEFRLLLRDVQHLPETQRTALLLREIDALSYDQIAEAMDTTVPSVKSLLVRARVGLAEAAEARQMSCDEVRFELGEVAEGLKRLTPPVRRHLKQCDRCSAFRRQLRDTNKALAAVFPVGGLLMIKKLMLAQFGGSAAGGGAGAAGTAAGTGAAAAGSAAAGGAAGGLVSAGMSAVATKAAAGLAAAAIVGVGAVEVRHAADHPAPAPVVAQRSQAAIPDNGGTAAPAASLKPAPVKPKPKPEPKAKVALNPATPVATTTPAPAATTPAAAPEPPAPTTETVTDTTVLPTEPAPAAQPSPAPAPAPPPAAPQDGSNGTGGTPAQEQTPPPDQGQGQGAAPPPSQPQAVPPPSPPPPAGP
jgi:RNA polymerase sigma factor (sigma-70 family)